MIIEFGAALKRGCPSERPSVLNSPKHLDRFFCKLSVNVQFYGQNTVVERDKIYISLTKRHLFKHSSTVLTIILAVLAFHCIVKDAKLTVVPVKNMKIIYYTKYATIKYRFSDSH